MIVRILIAMLFAQGASAQCPKQTARVELAGEEFTVEGYDAEAQILALRPQLVLQARQGRGAIRFAALDRPLVMPTTPQQLSMIIEAKRAGDLRFVMQIRHAPGPNTPEGCGAWEPRPMALQAHGQIIVALAEDAGVPPAPEVKPIEEVKIGAIRFAPKTPKFRTRAMAYHVAAVARGCLNEAERQGNASTGAVLIALSTSLAGLPKPPTRVVDGLVNRALSDCLMERIFERSATWHDAPPGSRVFVPVYFWPDRPPSKAREAKGTKAP